MPHYNRGVDAPIRLLRIDGDTTTEADDVLATEEPLEIRVGERPVTVTMRTPGDDFELAIGFVFTESIVGSFDDVEWARHWGSPNVVRVALRHGVAVDLQRLQRHFHSTSACGVCGKTSIDAVRVQTKPIASAVRVTRDVVTIMPAALRAQQKAFDATGGIHAAALFTPDGALTCLREDIGRHNAVDKVIGAALHERIVLDESILFVSGRAGFEVVQKAAVARIPVVAAVGAPSSLAVELARELNLTLAGFVRGERFNVYAGVERIV